MGAVEVAYSVLQPELTSTRFHDLLLGIALGRYRVLHSGNKSNCWVIIRPSEQQITGHEQNQFYTCLWHLSKEQMDRMGLCCRFPKGPV